MFKNKSLAYIILVFVLTGLYSLLYLKFPIKGHGSASFAVTIIYMFIPLAVTLFLQLAVYKEPLKDINIVWKWSNWYIVAALLPIALMFLTFGISLLFPGVAYDGSMSGFLERMAKMVSPAQMEKAAQQLKPMMKYMMLITLAQAMLAGVTVNAVAAFGEEAGWRGFLLSALKGRNFYVASIIIGLVWGFWHAPVIIQGHNYPEHPQMGIFMMAVFTMLLTPLMVYITVKSGSVLAAAFFHGVMNASAGMAIMYIRGGNDLTVGITGVAGFMALIILNVLLFLYDRFVEKEKIIVR
jgi:membrane protease YdiL (CAAX protease family)